jgi:ubiquinone/menaquinone biosynthesis C-methylase UbiE
MTDIQKLYAQRFVDTGLEKRDRVWKVLCERFFDPLINPDSTVLDLGCGYGEFINNVRCKHKIAVDMNPDAAARLHSEIKFYKSSATDLGVVDTDSIDAVFTSNVLEHLSSKQECSEVLRSVWRILKPNGQFIVLGPNIKYAYREYWDYYDHNLPFSELSIAEGLRLSGFVVARVFPRFLPYTMNSSLPTADLLVRIYLSMPIAWRIFGKQFLVIAKKQC